MALPGQRLAQRIAFYEFGRKHLGELLRLQRPPLSESDSLHQLAYIESYLQKLDCGSVVLEQHYVDRDHMEDHSIFYSRNLLAPPNYCRRLHFFKLRPQEAREKLAELLREASHESRDEFAAKCLRYSRQYYQGFSVIRPLAGSPVGRTVLVCFRTDPDDGGVRSFNCARDYRAHLMGVELTVHGLAFQQQDVGVSACATTALWSALSKVRDLEDIGSATPAQITTFASRNSLPYGRAMPSEGLSVDQMCQAVQAVGVAPELLRVFTEQSRSTIAPLARGYLYSATASGIAPVLILQRRDSAHAVTVVGMRLRDSYNPAVLINRTHDRAYDLEAIYVHDDRIGPGVRANIIDRKTHLALRLRVYHESGKKSRYETWNLAYILVPLHNKIRFSFAGLREVSLRVVAEAHAVRDFLPQASKRPGDRALMVSNWISRSTRYIETLSSTPDSADLAHVQFLFKRVPLPRYVGVIRVNAKSALDPIDVLVDTTSTRRNPNIIGVFPLKGNHPETRFVAAWIATRLNCSVISPRVRATRGGAARHRRSRPQQPPHAS